MNNSIFEWVTAVGTLGSALVALYVVLHDKLEARFNRATFEIKDFLFNTKGTWETLVNPMLEGQFGAVELKFAVEQISGGVAANVEVILKNILKFNEKGVLEKWPYFIPVNLTWGERKKKNPNQRFSKGIIRHCNLGVYGKDTEDNYSLLLASSEELGDPYTDLVSEDLPVGKYVLEIVLSGDNVKILNKRILLEMFGGWRENTDASFDKNLKVSFYE